MEFTFLIFYILPALAFLKNPFKRNTIFYLLILSPAITSFISLIFLFLNFYNFWLIFSLNLVLSIYGIFKIKKIFIPVKDFLFPIFILSIVFPFFLIKGEPYEGASDAGVYVSSALNLNEKGRYFLKFNEHLIKDLKNISIKKTEYSYKWEETYPGVIYQRGKFIPQFFPLYPIHLSIFFKIFKIKGLLLANYYFFFLSSLILYKILRIFTGSFYSKIGIFLFSLNPGMIYFIKYPTAEIFLCYLILSFFLFFLIYLKNNLNSSQIISSAFLSLSLTTKFLSYFLLIPLFLIFFFKSYKEKLLKFIRYFLFFSFIPFFSILLFNLPYFLNHLLPLVRLKFTFFSIIFGLFIYLFSKINFTFKKKILNLIPFLIFFFSIWATFIRPSKFEILEENNLKEFCWYLGYPTIIFSFFGNLFSYFNKKFLFFNINYYPFLFLIIYGTGDNPLHPFSFRRYIPIFLPLIVLYYSYFLKGISKKLSILITIICIFFPLYRGKNLLISKEGKGFLDLYFNASSIDFNEKILATSDTYFLTSQLNLIAKKKIYPLNIEDPDVFLGFQNFMRKNEKIHIFSSLKYDFKKILKIEGKIIHLQPERNKIPERITTSYPVFFLYEIESKNLMDFENIIIGKNDFGKISSFWDLEFDGERFFKWTKRESFFFIRLKDFLILKIDKGGNPEDPVPFRIYFKEKILFEGFAERGWKDYYFQVPKELKEKEVVLKFVTHSFQPLPDLRELGVKISEIKSK